MVYKLLHVYQTFLLHLHSKHHILIAHARCAQKRIKMNIIYIVVFNITAHIEYSQLIATE